ncbi:MAG: alpha/beta hydrolase [Bacteroidales bacterium]|nr:alpha/beta hydrolase [Bacteroidales bacterium]
MKTRLLFYLILILGLFACQRKESGYLSLGDGARLYYEECGQGEPLILLHGHSLDRRMWDSQFHEFSRQYRTIRFDFRGYGKSSEQTQTQQATHLGDLLRLMDALQIDKAHVVGLSMGAFVAGDMLALCPQRMLSCVLVSGGIRSTPGPSQPMDSVESAQRDREIAALRQKGVDNYKKEWLETLMSSGGSQKERMRAPLQRMIRDWSAWQPLHKEVRLFYGREAWEILRQRGKTDIPTLIVRGENEVKDRKGTPGEMEYLSQCRYVVLPDCGHMLNMEQPAVFNSLILDFLQQVRSLRPRVPVSTDIGGTAPDGNQ